VPSPRHNPAVRGNAGNQLQSMVLPHSRAAIPRRAKIDSNKEAEWDLGEAWWHTTAKPVATALG